MTSAESAEPEAGAAALPPRILGGRFRVDHHLGTGGMATVYAGWQLAVDRPVAIKVVRTERRADPAAAEALVAEARRASTVHHPNVVTILDCAHLADGRPAIVMERLTGHGWAEWVRATSPDVGAILACARQMCAGLGAIHAAGLLHGDLSASNVFVRQVEGLGPRVTLLDFGISRALGTVSGARIWGTPGTMVPELWAGTAVDARTDLWSLGALLYFGLTRRLPFPTDDSALAAMRAGPDLHLLAGRADMPTGLRALLASLLAPRPEDRPPDAGAVLAALSALTTTAAVVPTPGRSPGDRLPTGHVVASVLHRRGRWMELRSSDGDQPVDICVFDAADDAPVGALWLALARDVHPLVRSPTPRGLRAPLFAEYIGPTLHIVLPVEAGERLSARLARTGPVPWRTVLAWGDQLAEALGVLHAPGARHGWVHPGCVFLADADQHAILTGVGRWALAEAADDALGAFIARLPLHIERMPVVCVVAFGSGASSAGRDSDLLAAERHGALDLPLEPLTGAELEAMLTPLVGEDTARLPGPRVHALSGGWPGGALALLLQARTGGALVPTPTGHAFVGDAWDTLTLHPSLTTGLAGRIGELSASAIDVLRAVSIWTGEAPPHVLSALTHRPPEVAVAGALAGVRAGVLRSVGTGFELAHPHLATLLDAPEGEWRALHRRASRVVGPERPTRCAHHLIRAGWCPSDRPILEAAAALHLARGQSARARRVVDHLLDHADDARSRELRAQVARQQSDIATAVDDLSTALACFGPDAAPDHRTSVARRLSALLFTRGELERAEAVLLDTLKALGLPVPRGPACCGWWCPSSSWLRTGPPGHTSWRTPGSSSSAPCSGPSPASGWCRIRAVPWRWGWRGWPGPATSPTRPTWRARCRGSPRSS